MNFLNVQQLCLRASESFTDKACCRYKKIETYLLTALPLFFLSSQILAQKNIQIDTLTQKLDAYVNNLAPEKVYIQTDKDFYTVGDTIWFKSYMVNGINHFAGNNSKIIHVELLNKNGGLEKKRKLYADKGTAFGDIEIDSSMDEGDYRIRAYTRYMLNDGHPCFFEKKISIFARPRANNGQSYIAELVNNEEGKEQEKDITNSRISKPNVQFFPEGGNLVMGLQSGIGLKITDEFGKGIAIKGKILDQEGNIINTFQTYDFGLGVFPITPVTGMEYYAELHIDGIVHRYSLPTALDKGYVVQLKNQGPRIIVKVATNIDQGLAGTVVVGHIRGEVFLNHSKEDTDKKSYLIKFPTSGLADGVAHFTLFNRQGEPISERLTFIDNPENDMDLTLKMDKSVYKLREKVNLDMSIFDTKGKPLQGNFSISVALDKSFEERTSNIKSWLLLNSDLGYTVENPYYFFEGNSEIRKRLLDILMITHGGQSFFWRSFRLDQFSRAPEFPPEKGIMINGTTTAFNNRDKPRRALVTLSIFGQDVYQEKKLTDVQGKFSFGPLVIVDSVEAFINASPTIQNKNEKFTIYLDTSRTRVDIDNITRQKSHKKPFPVQGEHKKEDRDMVSDFEYVPKVTALSEVVVQAKRKTRKELIEEELNKMTVYGAAQNRLFPDSIPGSSSRTVFDLLTGVAGVQVLGSFPNQRVQIRGVSTLGSSKNPLFLLDRVPVAVDFIQSMSLNDVLFVDILKGGEAAFYGSRGTNGVVAIYTDRGTIFQNWQKEHPGVTNFVVQGFYKAREFYGPNYGAKKLNHKIPDYRTTLYWNPEVIINGKAQIKLDFYTGDLAGKYFVRIEGVTNDGNAVSKQYSFYVMDQ